MKSLKMLRKGLIALIVLTVVISLYVGKTTNVDNPNTNAISPGAKTIGTTSYAIPSNSLYVDPVKGNNTNMGTVTAPFQTIQKAIDNAASGQTIVLRGGTYHQIGIIITKSNLTIQSYPNESVWLDGSIAVTEWVQEGTIWVHSGWTAKFNSDPTDTWGKADREEASWRFVKTDFPMAPYPDQVWINDIRQEQVKTLSEVSDGKFYVDYAENKLYLGSNPTDLSVRASDLGSVLDAPVGGAPKGAAITVVAPNVTIRGIGIIRYATCVPDQGTIYVNETSKGLKLENVEIAYNATNGLCMSGADDVILQSVSSHDNGLTGICATRCDGLTLNEVLATKNNAESFNVAPVAAGVKIGRSRNITVSNSKMSDNRAHGLWFDEDCYDINIVSNEFCNNIMTGHEENHTMIDPLTGKKYTCVNEASGVVIELSGTAKIANNRIVNNSAAGLYVLMSDNIQISGNTISGSKYSLKIKNGKENGRERTWKLDADYPELSWTVDNIKIINNTIGGGTNNILLLQDDSNKRTGTMGVTSNKNVYFRASSNSPANLITCLSKNYPTLDDFKTATSQDSQSIELIGTVPSLD